VLEFDYELEELLAENEAEELKEWIA